jgi:hypothetical protein
MNTQTVSKMIIHLHKHLIVGIVGPQTFGEWQSLTGIACMIAQELAGCWMTDDTVGENPKHMLSV